MLYTNRKLSKVSQASITHRNTAASNRCSKCNSRGSGGWRLYEANDVSTRTRAPCGGRRFTTPKKRTDSLCDRLGSIVDSLLHPTYALDSLIGARILSEPPPQRAVSVTGCETDADTRAAERTRGAIHRAEVPS